MEKNQWLFYSLPTYWLLHMMHWYRNFTGRIQSRFFFCEKSLGVEGGCPEVYIRWLNYVHSISLDFSGMDGSLRLDLGSNPYFVVKCNERSWIKMINAPQKWSIPIPNFAEFSYMTNSCQSRNVTVWWEHMTVTWRNLLKLTRSSASIP